MSVFKYHAFIFLMRPPRWRTEHYCNEKYIMFLLKFIIVLLSKSLELDRSALDLQTDRHWILI